MRKTKIVCTLGPATEDSGILKDLLRAGMNVARFNMAHGDYDSHRALAARLREASRETGLPVALLLDTKGPEIRTGAVAGGETVRLEPGREVAVTVDGGACTPERVSLSYEPLPQEIRPGTHILIADGQIDLEVTSVEGRAVRAVVRTGGELGSHKNVNIPGLKVSLPAVTGKDRENIDFAISEDMDFLAASFVRRPENILEIRQILAAAGSHLQIVAKIEDQEGLANIDEIIRVSDAIMVARGDLGVQLPTEEIPLAQKRIILKCHAQNKAVITATQMLDSMTHNPKPTRAEATDVANAIFDGTDAVMLSGETASGSYPVLAVQTMDRIARAAEDSPEYESRVRRYFRLEDVGANIASSVTRSAYLVAREIRATAILTPSLRGNTPRMISRYRPHQPILAVTPSAVVARQLLLYWGVIPLQSELADNSDAMLNNAMSAAIDRGLVTSGAKVVILAGVPVHSPIMLNMVRVVFVGDVLAKGKEGFGGYCSGRIVRAEDPEEARRRLGRSAGQVLLTRFLTPEFAPLLPRFCGVVLEESSYLSRDEIRVIAPELVLISSVPQATSELRDGAYVSLNGDSFMVYAGEVRLEE